MIKQYTEQSENAYALRQIIRNDKMLYNNRLVIYMVYIGLNLPNKTFEPVAEFDTEAEAVKYIKEYKQHQYHITDGNPVPKRSMIKRFITDQMASEAI